MNLLGGCLELSEHCRMLLQSRQRGLVSHLEADVDEFMGERRELVAKAGLVRARLLQGERVSIRVTYGWFKVGSPGRTSAVKVFESNCVFCVSYSTLLRGSSNFTSTSY